MSEITVPEVLNRTEYLKLPPQEREQYVREILRQTVNMNPNGVTVSFITKKLPFDARTIEKHLSIMTYTNEIYTQKIGPTILYLPNSKPMHPVSEKALKVDEREYAAYLLNNRFGEFIFIQERKTKGFIKDIGGGILIPAKNFEQFVNYLDDTLKYFKEFKK